MYGMPSLTELLLQCPLDGKEPHLTEPSIAPVREYRLDFPP
jgi:hypothetical protein